MVHGQGGAEIGFDRGPTLTCNHEAPIAAYALDVRRDLAPHGSVQVRHIASPLTATDYKDPQAVCITGEVPREGVLQQARPAGAPWDAGPATNDKVRSVPCSMAVRRLLPEECEKLQGFEPGYTAIPWRGKPADQCPDGPRYRALGNSWAIPCVSWIGKRIQVEVDRG